MTRDPDCPYCRQVTSGDCGKHGPLVIPASASGPQAGEGQERKPFKMNVSREWIERMAKLEEECGDVTVGGGNFSPMPASPATPEAAHQCEWKDAIIDAAIVDWIYAEEHESNPRKAVNDLLAWQTKLALDPAVSKEAHDLHEQIARLRQTEAALRELVDRLENYYDFECTGGLLKNCVEWQQLKAMLFPSPSAEQRGDKK